MDILSPEVLNLIGQQLHADPEEIVDVSVFKGGMTNRSYVFTCKGKRYIIRLPGEGTNLLINRKNEAEVYRMISGLGLCDDPVYINPDNGIKITRFLEGARPCNPHDINDITHCMAKLRDFHAMNLQASHSFDIFGQIDFYEGLRKGIPSVYDDYDEVKARVLSLKSYIEAHIDNVCLTHIDAVPDNFLFCGTEGLQLTDWEYSGLQDPHVDIAMFCVYSMYDRKETDRLIDIYFGGTCDRTTRTKIYAYISACGLLWSNWCEYKASLGVTFGEYAHKQYDYAKEYSVLVMKELSMLQRVDPVTTFIPFAAVLALCIVFMMYPSGSSQILGSIRNFLGDKFGTFYLAAGLGVFLVSLWLAFSDIGRIVLGGQDEKPRYSFWTWGAMIFTCGLAADILFYSFCEWIFYAQDSHVKSLGNIQDWASTFPLFHWGLIPWSFYAVLASCFGFMLHVRGVNRQKYSEACRPILGKMTERLPGKIVDVLAVFALIAGTATTFSVASPLLASSVSKFVGGGGHKFDCYHSDRSMYPLHSLRTQRHKRHIVAC